MNEIEYLYRQTQDAYLWTNRLLETIPLQHWDILPEILQTSVNWQVGHLIVSHYYHSIWVIKAMQMDVVQKFPLKIYGDLFTSGSPENIIGKFKSSELIDHLYNMQEISLKIISELTKDELVESLESTGFPHPIANIKREAIEWNIHHTMYHNGQLGILARILNKRFDFGLKL